MERLTGKGAGGEGEEEGQGGECDTLGQGNVNPLRCLSRWSYQVTMPDVDILTENFTM